MISCISKGFIKYLCPPKYNLDAVSSVCTANTSASACSTAASANVEYPHLFIEVEAEQNSNDSYNNKDTEDENRLRAWDSRSYVTYEYSRLLGSREDAVQEVAFQHKEKVAKCSSHTQD